MLYKMYDTSMGSDWCHTEKSTILDIAIKYIFDVKEKHITGDIYSIIHDPMIIDPKNTYTTHSLTGLALWFG